MVGMGSLLEISRSEDAAEYEWRIPGSDIESLERGEWLWCPLLSFAGRRFLLLFGWDYKSSDSSPLELRLFRDGEPSTSTPLVRYWLRAAKGDGGWEEEEIGRGRREPGDSGPVSHPWLSPPELRRRMGCSRNSSCTLSVIIRLRTGPETDDEMKSLLERVEPTSSREVTAEKFTQTDIEDAQTNSEDVSNSTARREESTQTDSQDDEMRSLVLSAQPASHLEATAEKSTQTDFEDTLILKENFKKLLLHGSNHDVLLKVKEKDFKAHKYVLGARSPVFEAMFRHRMKENEEDKVTIEDVDPDCFGAFLTYVYTGDVEDLSPVNAVNLYYAADKYHIPSLKRRCVDVLKASLSTSLVCDVISLASTHGEEELLESALAFFTEHQVEVMETVEWQRFLLGNPIRASEVCLRAAKRHQASHNES